LTPTEQIENENNDDDEQDCPRLRATLTKID